MHPGREVDFAHCPDLPLVADLAVDGVAGNDVTRLCPFVPFLTFVSSQRSGFGQFSIPFPTFSSLSLAPFLAVFRRQIQRQVLACGLLDVALKDQAIGLQFLIQDRAVCTDFSMTCFASSEGKGSPAFSHRGMAQW